jgi:hypothetical protein
MFSWTIFLSQWSKEIASIWVKNMMWVFILHSIAQVHDVHLFKSILELLQNITTVLLPLPGRKLECVCKG